MTRDELEAFLRDILGITAKQVVIETIMLAVDNHVDYMVDIAFDELQAGLRG